ncbi:MAG: hypothetical protein WC613_05850 [Candidatus Aenigmatarchaeota archaeon]
MNVIVNGIAIGFLSAIFISVYAEGLFSNIFPIWLLYGIFAPFVSALVILVYTLKSRNKKDDLQFYAPKEE